MGAVIPSQRRFQRELETLGSLGLSPGDLRRELADRVTRLIPADGWCISAVDPQNLLITDTTYAGIDEDLGFAFYTNEYHQPDYGKHRELIARRDHGTVLSALTAGDLRRSNRYRTVLKPLGYEHELRLVVMSGDTPWGLIHLYRQQGRRDFSADELGLLADSHREIADAFQMTSARALWERTGGTRQLAAGSSIPATFVFAADGRLLGTAGPADACIAAFPRPAHPKLMFPVMFQSMLFAVPRAVSSTAPPPAQARVLDRLGDWWTLTAAAIELEIIPGAIAVTCQRMSGTELAGLGMLAFGLTAAERRVCELVIDGASTQLIARRLHLSAYTVQDRLKSIFAKAQVGSRGELVALLS